MVLAAFITLMENVLSLCAIHSVTYVVECSSASVRCPNMQLRVNVRDMSMLMSPLNAVMVAEINAYEKSVTTCLAVTKRFLLTSRTF